MAQGSRLLTVATRFSAPGRKQPRPRTMCGSITCTGALQHCRPGAEVVQPTIGIPTIYPQFLKKEPISTCSGNLWQGGSAQEQHGWNAGNKSRQCKTRTRWNTHKIRRRWATHKARTKRSRQSPRSHSSQRRGLKKRNLKRGNHRGGISRGGGLKNIATRHSAMQHNTSPTNTNTHTRMHTTPTHKQTPSHPQTHK